MKLRKTALIALMLGLTPASSLAAITRDHSVFGGIGFLSQNAGRLSASPSQETSLASAIFLHASLTGNFSLGSALGTYWGISPSLGYTPIGHLSIEGGARTRLLPITLRVIANLNRWTIGVGPGLLYTTISGDGGSVLLGNGTSKSSYANPDDSVSAKNYIMNLTVGYQLDRWRVDADALINAPFSSSRRAVNLLLSASYGLF